MSGTTHEHPVAGVAVRSRIVVGLADDDSSWDALRWALARAAREGGAVHAVRAIRADDRDGITSGCSGGSDRAVLETETGALRRLSAQMALGVGVARVPPVSLSWCRGRAPDVLVAASRDAEGVVVGRPARLGRTSRSLLDRARCPVTIVGPASGVRSGRSHRHVVVGVDASGAGPAGEAVAGVVREALHHGRAGDRVTVVAGFRPLPVTRDWPRGYRASPTVDEQMSAVREAALAVVDPGAEHLRREGADRGVTLDVIAWPQEPRRAVLGAARDLGADELVLPRGATWSARELLRLVRVAPCAVTTVADPARLRTMITPPRSGPGRAGAVASRATAR